MEILLDPTEGSEQGGDQVRVLSKSRLLRLRGTVSHGVIAKLDRALLIALDLPGQLNDEDNV